MPPKANPPLKSRDFGSRLSTKWLKLAVVIIVLVLLAGGGFYLYRHHQDQQKAKAAAQPYAYTYKNLNTYHLTGFKAGSGLKFGIPAVMGASATSEPQTTQTGFSQALVKDSRPVIIAQLNVASVYASAPPSAAYLKTLSADITNPKSTSYNAVTTPVKNYVTQRLASSYSFSFATPKALITNYLKSNTWSINFTAKPKTASTATSYPALDGTAVLAVGKSAFYYYFVDAVDYNWQSQVSFWQGVVNSLQIDQ